MIHDLLLRWIVTVLFVLSATECVFEIAAGRRTWTRVVHELMHFAMSIAMVAMAWPSGASLPTTGPMVFFLLAAVWFVAAGFSDAGHRVANGYHALMMSAMAWMYAVMNGNLLPGQRDATRDEHPPTPPHPSMPDMDMPGMDMHGTDTSSSRGDHSAWIDAIDWACTIGFAIAALWWVYRCFTLRKTNRTEPWHSVPGAARQALMAAGMAIMFAVML
ncbi:DUF5134 domain-containing protein [Mycobacterium attenuatum]|uniref:DUF5134 domain-containing protein n=1 Tax=Mycobacterium attenuatum TaxID=2341086 RepID=UPI000F03B3FA|nr:DUF5134 domain-containing protein [Mycobacterium attenuatum]VBA59024.1 hypothetical protein LAUMK41_03280 [Mycobacterium attenuatum]